MKGRETFYLTIHEIQRDLDGLMAYYNQERRHQGYRLGCRTPAQALCEPLGLPSLDFSSPTPRSTEEDAIVTGTA